MVKALSNLPKCSSVQYFNYFISVDEVVSNDNFVIAIICVKSVIDLSRKQYWHIAFVLWLGGTHKEYIFVPLDLFPLEGCEVVHIKIRFELLVAS